MDVVVIFNGLGNQMSQYAFYLAKKELNKNTRFIFDRRSLNTHNGYDLERVFGIRYKENITDYFLFLIFRLLSIERWPFLSNSLFKILKICGIKLIKEVPNYDFDAELVKSSGGLTFYYGGWHSEKYFKNIEGQILDSYEFGNYKKDAKVTSLIAKIESCNSISIHVRRGDFLSETNKYTYGAVCDKEYFETAINKMISMVDNPYFFVFSNDVAWVRDNLRYQNLTIVDFNSKQDSWKDMLLISHCKHNINSNSTFSWWGAWLNHNGEKKVIVPKYFINNVITKDFYPESWIKIIKN